MVSLLNSLAFITSSLLLIPSIIVNQINRTKGQIYFLSGAYIFSLFLIVLANNLIGMSPLDFFYTFHLVPLATEVCLSSIPLVISPNINLNKSTCVIKSPIHTQSSTLSSLHHWFITGFSDAESCFYIKIQKNNKYKTGWQVGAIFNIVLHKKDLAILESIQSYFGVGIISKQGKDSIQYRVIGLKDLKVIIDHFEKYPLLTKKRADYELFKQVVEIMNCKEHLTLVGLQQIVNLKASINLGLSDELKVEFSNTIPVPRPLVQLPENINPLWLAGFASGEGCFWIEITKSLSHKVGFQVKLKFEITQHSRDVELMKRLVDFLGCGEYYPRSNKDHGTIVVQRFSDISEKIVSFFDKYPILGVKALDFEDLCKAVKIVEGGRHLTATGLEELCKLKAGMNRGRSSS